MKEQQCQQKKLRHLQRMDEAGTAV